MSAQLPACQLLERYYGQAARLWPVAPPEDTWLLTHSAAMVSDNVALRQHWQASERLAVSPFEPFDYLPEGQVVLFWPKAHQLGKWWLEWLATCCLTIRRSISSVSTKGASNVFPRC